MLRYSQSLLVLMLLVAGCSNAADSKNESSTETTSETTSTPSEQQESPQQPQTASEESTQKSEPNLDGVWPKPLAAPRKSMKGNWVVNLFLGGKEFSVCLLKVDAKEDNSLTTTVLDVPAQTEKANLTSSEITQTSANVVLEMDPPLMEIHQIDFQGTLKDGVVVGNVVLNEFICLPARLIATDDTEIPSTLQPQTDQFNEELMQAVEAFQSSGSVELLQEFGKDHPESSSAIDALRIVFSQAESQKLEAADVDRLADNFFKTTRRWGSRLETFEYLQVGRSLATSRYLPETALKYIDEAQRHLTDDSPEQWKVFLESSKKTALVTYSISRLSHENEDVQKKSAQEIRQYQKEQPFNHRLLFALADYYEKQNQPDEAINWYAQLTIVLPLIHPQIREEWRTENLDNPLPSESLAELWKKIHSKTDGLDDYLNEVYEESIYSFLSKSPDPRAPHQGNRVVLCELYTGSRCPPCVAADIATGALEKTYPTSEVIVLRFHQHIPRSDPLVNLDSEARSGYYQIQSTPSVLLNGRMFPGVGGFMSQAEAVFNGLREAIDSQLSENTEISLKLSANAEDGTLKISAEVDGLENPSENLRLRLVLAEDEIHFQAGNGIRIHEMIVRSMPGGVRGVAPKEGKLHYSKAIKLSVLKQKLMDYLAAFEEGNGMEFPVKPLALDKLHLIAFVQDDSTREVLQVAAIPVTGMLEHPNAPKPETRAQKKTGNNDKKPAEAPKPK